MKDLDFDRMRKAMVDEQLVVRDITDRNVLDAFLKVPRHRFVADEYLESSYVDHPLPTGSGQTISQPYMAALMTQCLGIKGGGRVLEIGTGSGYQAAILAEIAAEVYSVERLAGLAEKAGKVLDELGYHNIRIKVADGTLGWKEHAPYDGIIVTAGAPGIPESLIGQLKDGARLVIPVGGSYSQVLTIAEKIGASVKTTPVCGCVFVPLMGLEGWQDKG